MWTSVAIKVHGTSWNQWKIRSWSFFQLYFQYCYMQSQNSHQWKNPIPPKNTEGFFRNPNSGNRISFKVYLPLYTGNILFLEYSEKQIAEWQKEKKSNTGLKALASLHFSYCSSNSLTKESTKMGMGNWRKKSVMEKSKVLSCLHS